MINTQRIEIALSKSMMTKMLIGSIAFVLIGLWLLIYQPVIGNPLFDNVVVKYGASVASILFFGFTMVFSIRKLVDKKPAFVIDDTGILDNSSAASVGLILWTDVIQISRVKVMKKEFVVIDVSNPEHYIKRQRSFLMRKSLRYNYKTYGSPFVISAGAINCNVNELVAILEGKFFSNHADK